MRNHPRSLTGLHLRPGVARRRVFRSQQHGIGIHVGIVCAHRRDRLPAETTLGCEDLRPGVGGAGRCGGGNGPVGVRTNHTGPERTLRGTCRNGRTDCALVPFYLCLLRPVDQRLPERYHNRDVDFFRVPVLSIHKSGQTLENLASSGISRPAGRFPGGGILCPQRLRGKGPTGRQDDHHPALHRCVWLCRGRLADRPGAARDFHSQVAGSARGCAVAGFLRLSVIFAQGDRREDPCICTENP